MPIYALFGNCLKKCSCGLIYNNSLLSDIQKHKLYHNKHIKVTGIKLKDNIYLGDNKCNIIIKDYFKNLYSNLDGKVLVYGTKNNNSKNNIKAFIYFTFSNRLVINVLHVYKNHRGNSIAKYMIDFLLKYIKVNSFDVKYPTESGKKFFNKNYHGLFTFKYE